MVTSRQAVCAGPRNTGNELIQMQNENVQSAVNAIVPLSDGGSGIFKFKLSSEAAERYLVSH